MTIVFHILGVVLLRPKNSYMVDQGFELELGTPHFSSDILGYVIPFVGIHDVHICLKDIIQDGRW